MVNRYALFARFVITRLWTLIHSLVWVPREVRLINECPLTRRLIASPRRSSELVCSIAMWKIFSLSLVGLIVKMVIPSFIYLSPQRRNTITNEFNPWSFESLVTVGRSIWDIRKSFLRKRDPSLKLHALLRKWMLQLPVVSLSSMKTPLHVIIRYFHAEDKFHGKDKLLQVIMVVSCIE